MNTCSTEGKISRKSMIRGRSFFTPGLEAIEAGVPVSCMYQVRASYQVHFRVLSVCGRRLSL